MEKELKTNAHTILDKSVDQLPLSSTTTAARTIKNGAAYARSTSGKTITITIPVVTDGKIVSFLSVTDSLTSTAYSTFFIICMVLIFWIFFISRIISRAINMDNYNKNTVAKIKNIERSPLTQSYLINSDDDAVTIALNHLGENIQKSILSNQEAKENLYEFIEFFQFPIFVYDGLGAIHRANAAFQNEFSDSKSIDTFSVYPEFLNFLVERIVRPDIQEKTFFFEKINSYYQVQFNPLEMISNRYLVAMNDVTSYHQISQAQVDFTANVSLAFKAPLERIERMADNIEPEEIRRKINQETDWLDELVSDTLTLTQPTVKLIKKHIKVDQMIQIILNELFTAIKRKNLQIELQLEAVDFKSDERKIKIILKKLIGNAISYSPNGGNIRILLNKGPKNLTFSVTDSGPGLSDIQKTQIFEQFYRADINKRTVSGAGLGLAIVKKNVKDLKGHVHVESKLGKGSTFTVTF
jgi:two-component system OmpR family sensor kinase